MLLLATSKGNYFQWTPEHDVIMRSPERRTNMGENCSSTEFSSAAEI